MHIIQLKRRINIGWVRSVTWWHTLLTVRVLQNWTDCSSIRLAYRLFNYHAITKYVSNLMRLIVIMLSEQLLSNNLRGLLLPLLSSLHEQLRELLRVSLSRLLGRVILAAAQVSVCGGALSGSLR